VTVAGNAEERQTIAAMLGLVASAMPVVMIIRDRSAKIGQLEQCRFVSLTWIIHQTPGDRLRFSRTSREPHASALRLICAVFLGKITLRFKR